MSTLRRAGTWTLAFGVLVGLMCTPGCSAVADLFERPTEPKPPALLDQPGIYDTSRGRVRVVGIFDRVELEGGFWAVVGVAPTESAESRVVAVIVNAEELGLDLKSLRGRYVEAIGTVVEGASVRMAGPEVEARSITIIAEEDPADALQPAQP